MKAHVGWLIASFMAFTTPVAAVANDRATDRNPVSTSGFDAQGSYSASIPTADVDLTTAQGWSTVSARARSAADSVCADTDAQAFGGYRDAVIESCRAGVVKDIMTALGAARTQAINMRTEF